MQELQGGQQLAVRQQPSTQGSPPFGAIGCCAQPESPAKTDTATINNNARFIPPDSFFWIGVAARTTYRGERDLSSGRWVGPQGLLVRSPWNLIGSENC